MCNKQNEMIFSKLAFLVSPVLAKIILPLKVIFEGNLRTLNFNIMVQLEYSPHNDELYIFLAPQLF